MNKFLGRAVLCILMTSGLMMAVPPAHAQQMGQSAFEFRVMGKAYSLQRAVALKQVKDGFGNRTDIVNVATTNNSQSVGTLSEIVAILEGDNSTLTVTSDPNQTNTGSQGSTSDQNANTSVNN